jgi:uncharacterized protein (TIGR03086 family)
VTDAPLTSLASAIDATGQLVGSVRDEQWEQPSACSDWSIRQLVNHLVGGDRLCTRVLRGEPLPPMDQLIGAARADQLGDDPAAAYRATAAELLEALRAPGVLDGVYTVPMGTLPGPAVAHLRLVETLVHGWDLASGLGTPAPYPDALVEPEIAVSRDLLTRLPEGRHPFAPSQPVAYDAPAIDRLAALLGRSPS